MIHKRLILGQIEDDPQGFHSVTNNNQYRIEVI